MKKFCYTLLLSLFTSVVAHGQVLPSVVDIHCLRLHPDNIPVHTEDVELEGLERLWVEHVLKAVYTKGAWTNFSREIPQPFQWKAAHPVLSPDGRWLFFAANIPGVTQGWDILFSQHSSSGWSNPMVMGGNVNTGSDENLPRWVTRESFTFSRNDLPVEVPIKEAVDEGRELPFNFTSVRMFQEVLSREKMHVPVYLKTTMPLSASREQRLTTKYVPEAHHIYSIQLGKFRHPDWLAIDQFKDLGDIMLYQDNAGHLYIRLGPFESIENANEAMNQIKRRKWFETAFIMFEE